MKNNNMIMSYELIEALVQPGMIHNGKDEKTGEDFLDYAAFISYLSLHPIKKDRLVIQEKPLLLFGNTIAETSQA